MWTSERSRNPMAGEPAAELGAVTLGGDPAGVSLGGERRWLNVYGPGGYSWRPTTGDKVLVLKAGAEGEVPCILGMLQDGDGLRAGEVRLKGGGDSSIFLGQDRLELRGSLYLNGQPLYDVVRDIVVALLA